MRNSGRGDNASRDELRYRKKEKVKKKKKENRKDRTGSVRDGERTELKHRWMRMRESRVGEEEGRVERGGEEVQGGEGHCEFGGSRFPRDVGRKVPAGPVLSPRQDDQPAISNIKPTCTGSLSSTRYPNLPCPFLPRATNRPLTDLPTYPIVYRIAVHTTGYHQNLRLAHYISISPRAYVVCSYNVGIFVAGSTRGAQFATERGHFVLVLVAREKLFPDDIKKVPARGEREREPCEALRYA